MARLNSNQEVFHDLRTVGFYADDATSTTTSGALSVGDTAVAVTSDSGFSVGDVIRVGANGNTCDVIEASAVTGNTITSKLPLANAHASGVAVTLLTLTDLGATTEAGVTIDISQDETPLVAGTQKGVYLYLSGSVEQQLSWSCLNFNPENLLQSVGVDETSSNYFSSSPNGAVLNPNVFASLGEKPWLFEGLREDASTVQVRFYAAKVAAANQSITLTTGTAAEVPFQLRSTGAYHVLIE